MRSTACGTSAVGTMAVASPCMLDVCVNVCRVMPDGGYSPSLSGVRLTRRSSTPRRSPSISTVRRGARVPASACAQRPPPKRRRRRPWPPRQPRGPPRRGATAAPPARPRPSPRRLRQQRLTPTKCGARSPPPREAPRPPPPPPPKQTGAAAPPGRGRGRSGRAQRRARRSQIAYRSQNVGGVHRRPQRRPRGLVGDRGAARRPRGWRRAARARLVHDGSAQEGATFRVRRRTGHQLSDERRRRLRQRREGRPFAARPVGCARKGGKHRERGREGVVRGPRPLVVRKLGVGARREGEQPRRGGGERRRARRVVAHRAEGVRARAQQRRAAAERAALHARQQRAGARRLSVGWHREWDPEAEAEVAVPEERAGGHERRVDARRARRRHDGRQGELCASEGVAPHQKKSNEDSAG